MMCQSLLPSPRCVPGRLRGTSTMHLHHVVSLVVIRWLPWKLSTKTDAHQVVRSPPNVSSHWGSGPFGASQHVGSVIGCCAAPD
jgi:hypothetical protein